MRRIFYYCYDNSAPAGGEKDSYQHVDILNHHGYEAYAYHRKPGMRLTWFDNETKVVDSKRFVELYNRDRDILVFPENLGPEMLRYPGRRVIFNKGVFGGFAALKFGALDPYIDSATVAVLAVSEHNAAHLRVAYPTIPIYRVYAHIRSDLFVPKPFHEKSRRIIAPAKEMPILTTIYRMFNGRSSKTLNGTWEWLVLSGHTERETASLLADSPVLVFPSVHEGLPRLPLEAMCCDCLVAAFKAGPLVEILPLGQGFTYGDLMGMLCWLERLITSFPDVTAYSEVLEAQQKIAKTFSESRQISSVCTAWEAILQVL
jgi:hypothetical protein